MSTVLMETAAPLAFQRLPSTRPIDHRWDRSRGIIFSAAKRASANDQTWSHNNGIVFASTPVTTHKAGYATRSFQDTASSQKAGPTTTFSLSNAHGMGGSADLPMRKELEDLRRQVKILGQEKSGLENQLGKAHSRQAELAPLAEKAKDLQRRVTHLESQARDARQEGADRSKRELQPKIDSLTKDVEKMFQIMSKVRVIIQHAKPSDYGNAAETQQSKLDRIMADLGDISDMTALVRNARQAGVDESTRLLQPTIDRLTAELDKTVSHEKALQGEVTKSTKLLDGISADSQAQLTMLSANLELLQNQLAGRLRRRETSRFDYESYRQIFDDFRNHGHDILATLGKTKNALGFERREWERSERIFRQSPQLNMFRHAYPDLERQLGDFLSDRASSCQKAFVKLDDTMLRFLKLLNSFKATAHTSRMLSHHLVFEESGRTFTAVDLVGILGMLTPFRNRRHDLLQQRNKIHEQIRLARSPESSSQLVRKREIIDSSLSVVRMVLEVFEDMRKVQSLEMLLDKSLAEKAFFLRFEQIHEALTLLSDKDTDRPKRYTRDRGLYQDNREVQLLNSTYKDTLRQRLALESDLGKLSQNELDEALNTRLDKAKDRLECSFTALLEGREASYRLRLRQSISPSSNRDATAKAASTSDSEAKPAAPATRHTAMAFQRATLGGSSANLKPSARGRHERRERRSLKKHSDKSRAQEREQQGETIVGEASESSQFLASSVANESHSSPEIGRASYVPTSAMNFTPTSSLQARCIPTPSRNLRFMHVRAAPVSAGEAGHGLQSFQPCPISKPLETSSGANSSQFLTPAHVLQQEHHMSEQMTSSGACESRSFIHQQSATGLTDIDNPDAGPRAEQASSFDIVDDEEPHLERDEQEDLTTNQSPSGMTYRIPENVLRDALITSKTCQGAYWSHRLYRNAENKHPQVYYCTTLERSEQQAQLFLGERVLGFDIEWETRTRSKSRKAAVSLIQIACEDKIGLFQLGMFDGEDVKDLMPPTLKQILEDPNTTKAGVNISGDATRLRNFLDVKMKGVFELSHLYRVVKFSENSPGEVSFRLVRLAVQVHDVLRLELKKDEVRTSQWSTRLNGQQTEYAAADAYAGFQLYHHLDHERELMNPTPPRPAFYETYQPLVLGDGSEVFRKVPLSRATRKRTDANTEIADEADLEDEEFFDAEEYLGDEVEFKPTFDDSFSGSTSIVPVNPASGSSDHRLQSMNTSSGTGSNPPKAQTRQRPSSAETELADAWVTERRNEHAPSKTGPSTLRAYHLWHSQGLKLSQIAALCSQPPLAITTVASYILTAIKEEDLPFETERVSEVLNRVPPSVHWRYRKIVGSIERGSD